MFFQRWCAMRSDETKKRESVYGERNLRCKYGQTLAGNLRFGRLKIIKPDNFKCGNQQTATFENLKPEQS